MTNSTRFTNPGKLYVLVAALLLSIPVQANDMGFVVSHIEFALSDGADASVACPDGMSQSYQRAILACPKFRDDPRKVIRNFTGA